MTGTTPPARPDRGPGRAPAAAGLFDGDYRRLLEPFHPEREAREETAALRELLGLAQHERVLDLGCGWGRHLSLLADAGHDVFGLDLSLPLLRQVPRTRAGRAPLIAADMRWLPLAGSAFDAVLNVATSLGLFLHDDDARLALQEARRVLRPDGRLLLEGMHRDDVACRFAPRDRWVLDDGTEVRARRRFDPLRGISHEVLRWRGPGGAGEKRHSLRIRSATEVAVLLERAGLRVEAAWGDWDARPLALHSPRLILLARA